MNEIHPDVQAALDAARELRHKIADLRERIDAIAARRPSPSGAIIPEVDAMGRLRSLYLAPGTADHFECPELVTEIMAAIRDSTADSARQYEQLMDQDPWGRDDSAAESGAAESDTAEFVL